MLQCMLYLHTHISIHLLKRWHDPHRSFWICANVYIYIYNYIIIYSIYMYTCNRNNTCQKEQVVSVWSSGASKLETRSEHDFTNKIKAQPNNLVLTETHDFQRFTGKGQHRTTTVPLGKETAPVVAHLDVGRCLHIFWKTRGSAERF